MVIDITKGIDVVGAPTREVSASFEAQLLTVFSRGEINRARQSIQEVGPHLRHMLQDARVNGYFADEAATSAVERIMLETLAGLRYGNNIEKDMIAVMVAPKSDAILVAAPAYLRRHAFPRQPRDLCDHQALMCRSQLTGQIIPWSLRCGGETIQIAPRAATVVHDLASQLDLTVRGRGILSAPVSCVSNLLETEALSQVLPEWSSPMEAVYIDFPSRRHQSAALRAFVAFLQEDILRRNNSAGKAK
ncbi:DNA-binding transcriptional LysR family regulator [Rhizobium sp. BK512]|uniref:LysR substrate-binding domain-containing protein n=1 Tax=Rhizobium sp. BK512 TaxID=2587010 RepID=UPI001618624F|nr:LysR substrate-binding domain-containing protein [Rhizobium sp. BK512]MBB3565798.1 DNA-binding transcriptional LysR family regulator [Rhizobium sp. BK512]